MVDSRTDPRASPLTPSTRSMGVLTPGALPRTITSSGDANKENGPGWSFRSLNLLPAGTNCSATSCATAVVPHDGIANSPAECHLCVAGHTFHA